MATKFNKSGLGREENQNSVGYKYQCRASRKDALEISQERKKKLSAIEILQDSEWEGLSNLERVEKVLASTNIRPEIHMGAGSEIQSIRFPNAIGIVLSKKEDIDMYKEIKEKVANALD